MKTVSRLAWETSIFGFMATICFLDGIGPFARDRLVASVKDLCGGRGYVVWGLVVSFHVHGNHDLSLMLFSSLTLIMFLIMFG